MASRSGGRPPKLTPEVEAKILLAIRGGNFRGASAEWAGVSASTMTHWMTFGKRKPRSAWGRFRRAVLEAERAAEINCVRLVLDAAKKDAKHAEWWLERKQPKRWARQAVQKHELSGPGGKPLEVNAEVKHHEPDPARVLAVLAILRSAGAAPDDVEALRGADGHAALEVHPARADGSPEGVPDP